MSVVSQTELTSRVLESLLGTKTSCSGPFGRYLVPPNGFVTDIPLRSLFVSTLPLKKGCPDWSGRSGSPASRPSGQMEMGASWLLLKVSFVIKTGVPPEPRNAPVKLSTFDDCW